MLALTMKPERRCFVDTDEIAAEMQRAAADFRSLLDDATSADLRGGSDGTKWTNEQLLFHMLFGYLVVRNLRVLVWIFGRLPDGFSRAFATLLNTAPAPSTPSTIWVPSAAHGSWVTHGWSTSSITSWPGSCLDAPQSAASLGRGMHFPTGWDPYFRDYMTMADVYHYATQHYGHHRRQLTLPGTAGTSGPTSDLLPHGRL